MAGIYIHIPFCHSRCTYCDFYTVINTRLTQDFTNALCKEFQFRKNYLDDEKIQTIYFGGGTPSVLNEAQLTQIFATLKAHFDIDVDAEITMEANPDDITPEYVEVLRKQPVNRISMGVQSFDDEDLKFMNRRHSSEQGVRAVELLHSAGISNITIDLIYGLPKQTPEKWRMNLQKAFQLPVQHLSCYHLTYEEGTVLYRLKQQKKITPVIETISQKMFEVLMDETKNAGFEHYEISNFAKPGFYSKHNSSYWMGKKYLGLGPSAHSYNRQQRAWNKKGVAAYIKAMDEKLDFTEVENLTEQDKFNEYIITRLRTHWGCDVDELKQRFPGQWTEKLLRSLTKWEQSEDVSIRNNGIFLTQKGILVSDAVLADVILDDEDV